MFIQSQKIREKTRRHQWHQSLPKNQDVKSVQTSQDEPQPLPDNKPVRITHKQSHKCCVFERFSVISVNLVSICVISEQTDHSDRTEDHHTEDLAEVHKCNMVLSDGHKQLDMQRQGFTVPLTVKCLLNRKRERGKKTPNKSYF